MKKLLKEGFTLIELVIIMVVLGILAAVAIPKMGGTITSSEEAAENTIIASLQSAVEVYAMDQVVLTSSKSYPPNPFFALDDKSQIKLTGVIGGHHGDGATPWGYHPPTNAIYHLRNDGSEANWTYNSSTGEIF